MSIYFCKKKSDVNKLFVEHNGVYGTFNKLYRPFPTHYLG